MLWTSLVLFLFALVLGAVLTPAAKALAFRVGMIGSTDSHTGLASAEEPNFWGKMATDSIPENKAGFNLLGGGSGWTMGAAGLAAVLSGKLDTRGKVTAVVLSGGNVDRELFAEIQAEPA